jgi:hypothetical protein
MQPHSKKYLAVSFWLGIGMLMMWVCTRSDSRLLDRATRHQPNSKTFSDEIYSGYFRAKYHRAGGFYWLNEREVLRLESTPDNQIQVFRSDLRLGDEQRVPKLERMLNGSSDGPKPFYWDFSPDGRWLLLAEGRGYQAYYTAVDVNDGKQWTWKSDYKNQLPIWLSNSQGLVEWMSDSGRWIARIYRIDSGHSQDLKLQELRSAVGSEILVKNIGAAVTPLDEQQEGGGIALFDLASTNIFGQMLRPPFPLSGRSVNCVPVLAPSGDKIAWLIYVQLKRPEFVWLRRYPYLQVTPRHVVSLWETSLDGKVWREFGHLLPGEDLRQLEWSPDGRQLGFVHEGALWTVLAE